MAGPTEWNRYQGERESFFSEHREAVLKTAAGVGLLVLALSAWAATQIDWATAARTVKTDKGTWSYQVESVERKERSAVPGSDAWTKDGTNLLIVHLQATRLIPARAETPGHPGISERAEQGRIADFCVNASVVGESGRQRYCAKATANATGGVAVATLLAQAEFDAAGRLSPVIVMPKDARDFELEIPYASRHVRVSPT